MRNRRNYGYFIIIVLAVILVAIFSRNFDSAPVIKEVSFSELATELRNENVVKFETNGTRLQAELKNGNIIVSYAANIIEISWINETYVFPQMQAGKIHEVSSPKPSEGGVLATLLPTLLMVGVLIFVMYFIINSAGGGGGKVMQFGKSRARLHKSDAKKVTYDEVAGLDEEKEELEEVVDFLKNPAKYNELGARIPKGILLVGPPGTGKTYLSKATAG
jgi:cell division protease FtsH